MPSQTIIQHSFAAGVLSPRMRGRVDLAQYAAGAQDLTNILVQTQGGAAKRPGSYHAGASKPGSRVRLVPFIVSSAVAFVVEFGPLYCRFWRNRAQVLASGVPQELVSPYALADLRALKAAQSADVMYLFHPGHQPQKLARTAAGVFTLTPVVFGNGPYDAENTGDVGASPPSAASSGAETDTAAPAPVGTGVGDGADPTGPPPSEGGDAEAAGGEPGGDPGAESESGPGGLGEA